MWSQLAEMFGKSFLREHGDEPSRLWTQAVDRLTDQQIMTGLVNLGNDGLQFPPNLSMFVEACKRQKLIAPWRSLPAPPPDPQKEADRAWRDMEKLAGRKLRNQS